MGPAIAPGVHRSRQPCPRGTLDGTRWPRPRDLDRYVTPVDRTRVPPAAPERQQSGPYGVPSGVIDLTTAPQVRQALAACLSDGVRSIDVDLAAVAFCDAGGLDAFLLASRSRRPPGRCDCAVRR